MNLRSKEPYWLLKNGIIHSYPSLDENISCDVLIIGGGVSGALLAHKLSQQFQVVVIDKRDIALGSSSASTGMLQYEIDEPLYVNQKVGEEAAVESYKAGVSAIGDLEDIVRELNTDCGFSKKRSIYMAANEKDAESLLKEYHCRKQYDFDVEWLTADQLKGKYSVTGYGAILSQPAASLDTYAFCHALFTQGIAHNNLRVFDHTETKDIEYGDHTNTVVTDKGFRISCNHIVFATGYESQELLKLDVVKLISTFALVSEPLAELPLALRNNILWNTDKPYLYVRTTDDNRILVGGGDVRFKNALARDKLIELKETALTEALQEILPTVKFIPDFSWAGTFGITKDSLPYIGVHPDYANSSFVLAFGGNGITFSVMGMQLISDLLNGKSNRLLTHFRFNR